MSSVEWRREQPRVDPPAPDNRIRNPLFTALLLFDGFVWAASFADRGDVTGLVFALMFGFLAAKVP